MKLQSLQKWHINTINIAYAVMTFPSIYSNWKQNNSFIDSAVIELNSGELIKVQSWYAQPTVIADQLFMHIIFKQTITLNVAPQECWPWVSKVKHDIQLLQRIHTLPQVLQTCNKTFFNLKYKHSYIRVYHIHSYQLTIVLFLSFHKGLYNVCINQIWKLSATVVNNKLLCIMLSYDDSHGIGPYVWHVSHFEFSML